MERVNMSNIKKDSFISILNSIVTKDKISRAEIAEQTKLSLMTVGKAVDALLEQQVIAQTKETKHIAGRKAGLVCLHPSKFIMLIDLSNRNFTMTVRNASLTVRDVVAYHYNMSFFFEENLYIFLKNVKIYMLRQLEMQHCIGIGVLIPGKYDRDNDRVQCSQWPEMETIGITRCIEEVLKLKADMILEDMIASAHALTAKLDTNKEKMIAYLYTGWGLCSTLLYRGALLRGKAGGCAGNIGWMPNNARLEQAVIQQGWTDTTGQAISQAAAALLHLAQPDVMVIENHLPSVIGEPEQYLRERLPQLMQVNEGEIIPEIIGFGSDESQAQDGLSLMLREQWLHQLLG